MESIREVFKRAGFIGPQNSINGLASSTGSLALCL